jgi:actin-related protein 6
MTEPLFNLPSIRSSTLETVFEGFGFESFYSAPAAQFAVHKWAADNPDDIVAQSLSGVVLDAGYSFTHAVPIFDGSIQVDAVRRIRLGGKLLTNLIKEWVCTYDICICCHTSCPQGDASTRRKCIEHIIL